MTHRRAAALAALVATAAALLSGSAAAQSFTAQPQLYLLTTDAFDARALWIQPAGLAAIREASVSGFFTTATQRGQGPTQYGLSLASGGLGLSWQHDRLGNGASDNQWAIGLGVGNQTVKVGVARRWIRGANANDAALDLGMRITPRPSVLLSLAWRDIGSPVVRDTVVRAVLVPGAALALFGARARIGVDWELVTRGWGTSALRAGASIVLPLSLALSVRADYSGSLHARGVVLALTWNAASARAVAFGAWPSAGGVSQAGAWAAAVRSLDAPRRTF